MAWSVTRYYAQLSSCTLSEKTNDPILRKITYGWMDRWMDGRTDGQTTDGWRDRRMDGWTDELTDRKTNGRMDGWMDGRTNGWMDEPMDQRTDSWRDIIIIKIIIAILKIIPTKD